MMQLTTPDLFHGNKLCYFFGLRPRACLLIPCGLFSHLRSNARSSSTALSVYNLSAVVMHSKIVVYLHTSFFRVLSGQTVFTLRSMQGAVCLLRRVQTLCEQPWAPHTPQQVGIQPKSSWGSLAKSPKKHHCCRRMVF